MPLKDYAAYKKIDASLIWRTSPEREVLKGTKEKLGLFSMTVAAIFVLGALALSRLTPLYDAHTLPLSAVEMIQIALIGSAVFLVIIATSRYLALRRAFFDRVRTQKGKDVIDVVNRFKNKPELTLANLFVLNRRQLDEYHVLSVRQQQVAFRNAQVAAIIGFAVLIVGTVLSYKQAPGAERYVTAGLTALGSLLSGFISAVFFRSSDATAKQLRDFYEEPSRTGQMLMIERVAKLDAQDPKLAARLRLLMVERFLEQLADHEAQRARLSRHAARKEASAALAQNNNGPAGEKQPSLS